MERNTQALLDTLLSMKVYVVYLSSGNLVKVGCDESVDIEVYAKALASHLDDTLDKVVEVL